MQRWWCHTLFYLGIILHLPRVRGYFESTVTIQDDQVYLDPETHAIKANLSTSTLVSNWTVSDKMLSSSAGLFYSGVLFVYNRTDGDFSDLLDNTDYIVVVPVFDYTQGRAIVNTLSDPRIKAGIVYPSTPSSNYAQISTSVITPRMSLFLIDYAAGTQLSNQISLAQYDPEKPKTSSSRAHGSNGTRAVSMIRQDDPSGDPTSQDPRDIYYCRIWARLYRSGAKSTSSSGTTSVNTILVVAITIPLGVIIITIIFCFIYQRQKRLSMQKEVSKNGSRHDRRRIKVQLLLSTPAYSRRAPALTSDQLRQLPVVTYTEDSQAKLRLCTDMAIHRFRLAHNTLATSSDEESDGESEDLTLEELVDQETPYSGGCDENYSNGGLVVTTDDSTSGLARPPRIYVDGLASSLGSSPPVPSDPLSPYYDPQFGFSLATLRDDSPTNSSTMALTDRETRRPRGPSSSLAQLRSTADFAPRGASGTHRRIQKTTTYESVMSDLKRRTLAGPPLCPVCESAFDLDDVLRLLPCGHAFHGDCVDEWLTQRVARCPLCKYNATPGRKSGAFDRPGSRVRPGKLGRELVGELKSVDNAVLPRSKN
ncbi:hypothetical protein IWQ60_004864 [Tieghemiomyces parasiticus]|uniref:RING-type domain-containing protein n=1 Tax=Tieghemiomyces parasiticus TaxID=78921 RepID=A0A9W8ACV3_9FUNG|nr:hypothetical protein IWQ60_004864 [Tieghemiomyces parasiticus]